MKTPFLLPSPSLPLTTATEFPKASTLFLLSVTTPAAPTELLSILLGEEKAAGAGIIGAASADTGAVAAEAAPNWRGRNVSGSFAATTTVKLSLSLLTLADSVAIWR